MATITPVRESGNKVGGLRDIQMVHLAISALDKHLYCTGAVVIGDHWVGCYGHSGLQINPGWRHTQLTSSYQNHYM